MVSGAPNWMSWFLVHLVWNELLISQPQEQKSLIRPQRQPPHSNEVRYRRVNRFISINYSSATFPLTEMNNIGDE